MPQWLRVSGALAENQDLDICPKISISTSLNLDSKELTTAYDSGSRGSDTLRTL